MPTSPWSARRVVLTLVLLLPAAVSQRQGEALEGLQITSIEFENLQRLSPDAVRGLMDSKVGGAFNRDRLDGDVSKLVKQDIFKAIPSVQARKDSAGTGVAVIISVHENRRVLGLVFLGAVEFDREKLLPLIKTRQGALVDSFTLELDRQELLRYYRENGYHYCEIEYVKDAEPLGEVVFFKLTEGPEVKIRNVVFQGNAAFSKGELLKEMPFVEEPGFLSISSKPFVLDQVRRDMVQLAGFYHQRGFLDAQVTLLPWTPTANFEKVDLTIDVTEGEPYVIKTCALEGMTLFDPNEAITQFRSQPGARYEPGVALRKDIRDLEKRYHDLGYTEARVRDATTILFEGNEVSVVLQVSEGARVQVGEIIIEGITETQDRILRREIELYTGEPMNLEKLRRAQRRIRSLNYWELDGGLSVDSTPIPVQSYGIYRDAYVSLRDTDREDVKNVVVRVKEADTGSLRFAAGVGSNSGFLADITYRKNNFDPLDFPESFDDILDAFTGGGQFLVLSFQPGTVFSRWRVQWGNPRVFDSHFGVVGEIFQTQFRLQDWDEERFGYSIRIGRRLADDLSAAITLRDELVDVTDIDNSAPQLVFDFEGENRVTSISFELRLSRLDDFVDPTDGYTVNFQWEHAGLWGDIEFNKAFIQGEHYIPLFEDESERVHVLQLKGALGWASEFGSTRDVPVYERFFLGGAGTLRGFRFRGIGPEDNGEQIGGKAMWSATIEYAYPLIGENIRGVAFIDAGSVARTWSDPAIGDARVAVGVGVRLVIPFLGPRPIAIDFGIPIVDFPGDEKQLLSFSFGSNF